MRTLMLTAAALAAASSSLVAVPALADSARSDTTLPVKLEGYLFNNKANLKASAKVGDSAKFTWAGGVHNVVSQTVPKGAKKVNSGSPADKHAPLTYRFTKPGTYVMYCVPHKALGMIITVTVKK